MLSEPENHDGYADDPYEGTPCHQCGEDPCECDEDDADYEGRHQDDLCPTCGGEGVAEYDDCPEAWGEDCPSEVNHLIDCPNCGGSGDIKDCHYF